MQHSTYSFIWMYVPDMMYFVLPVWTRKVLFRGNNGIISYHVISHLIISYLKQHMIHFYVCCHSIALSQDLIQCLRTRARVHVHVRGSVCMCVCLSVCLCVTFSTFLCVYTSAGACSHMCILARPYVRERACAYACFRVCMNVCMHEYAYNAPKDKQRLSILLSVIGVVNCTRKKNLFSKDSW